MTPNDSPAGTRDKLIAAGLFLFGRDGFEATSTRALAGRAQTNVASIAYHFGGKDGLRRACAEHVAAQVSAVFADIDATPCPRSPASARQELERMVHDFAALLLTDQRARDFVPFVMRELSQPGQISDLIFERLFLPRHERLCQLWSVATGQPAQSDTVKLAVFAAIGQVLYFRIATPFVTRRLGWPEIGPAQAEQIAQTVVENLRASLERAKR